MTDIEPPADASQLSWRISTYSGANSACVAGARRPDGNVSVRNSNTPDQDTVTFTPIEWDAFLAGVKDGEFDDL